MISYYMGRPVTELSREELIEAVEQLGCDLETARESHRAQMAVFRKINQTRRERERKPPIWPVRWLLAKVGE